MKIVPVIMSGGSGTRLWPLSRKASPKQLHALVTELTLIQHSLHRVTGDQDEFEFCEPLVVLNETQLGLAQEQVAERELSVAEWVVEPFGRNTAPVASVAAELVAAMHGSDALILLMPADHHIEDEAEFQATVHRGAHLAVDGRIVTFGIRPSGPATGFGYIQRGHAIGDGYEVAAFTEKPDEATAKDYLRTGGYYWNAGIFLFAAQAVTREMQAHCPDVLKASHAAVARGVRDGAVLSLDPEAFADCPDISFDYAVMETTSRAAVVPADFGWSDVGSWSQLWDVCPKDETGNVVRGDVHLESTENSLVVSTQQRVGVLGADNLVIVVTEDAVLVAHKDHDQAVKKLVNKLKADGRLDLL